MKGYPLSRAALHLLTRKSHSIVTLLLAVLTSDLDRYQLRRLDGKGTCPGKQMLRPLTQTVVQNCHYLIIILLITNNKNSSNNNNNTNTIHDNNIV
jgi:hypothetical protein